MEDLKKAIPSANGEAVDVYSVIHRVEGMESGIYQGNYAIARGGFSEKAGYLCVNQAIARDSAATLFFVANYRNYQTAMQLAGFLGQRVYLSSNYQGINCSGIGAYYDDETREFLGTDRDVLYAMAIGN